MVARVIAGELTNVADTLQTSKNCATINALNISAGQYMAGTEALKLKIESTIVALKVCETSIGEVKVEEVEISVIELYCQSSW